jgi:trehalose-6-phosphatase
MTERVYLQGSEEVSSASHVIRRAAEEMKQAAGSIEGSLFEAKRFLDDWILRFEQAIVEDKRLQKLEERIAAIENKKVTRESVLKGLQEFTGLTEAEILKRCDSLIKAVESL